MTNINTLADSCSCAAAPGFAVGAVVELADSHLAGLHWEITRKSARRKRSITTVVYTLRLLRTVQPSVLVNADLFPCKTLDATQLTPEGDTSCPLTVASVNIKAVTQTRACQVEITAVTLWFGGNFHAPLPEADTYMTHKK